MKSNKKISDYPVAIVTGGGSGIGLSVVKKLLKKNFVVYACTGSNTKNLDNLTNDFESDINNKLIVKKFNLHQLSTGELLREEIKKKTELGLKISSIINSGDLVSDIIVSELIEKFISKKEYMNRIIFDGYPRNLSQAKNLKNMFTIS